MIFVTIDALAEFSIKKLINPGFLTSIFFICSYFFSHIIAFICLAIVSGFFLKNLLSFIAILE